MQIITMYLRADSVNARLVDSYNQTISSLPALTRGMRAELILKLLDAEGDPLSGDLADYASWDFVIADDWNTATPPQVREPSTTLFRIYPYPAPVTTSP